MQGSGAFSQNMIIYNIYNKAFAETKWNYHNYFEDTKHTDKNPIISQDPVDFDPKESLKLVGLGGIRTQAVMFTVSLS